MATGDFPATAKQTRSRKSRFPRTLSVSNGHIITILFFYVTAISVGSNLSPFFGQVLFVYRTGITTLDRTRYHDRVHKNITQRTARITLSLGMIGKNNVAFST